jgi:hypothetical protein
MASVRPRLITTEENKSLPVLIIDKNGIVGSALAQVLKEQFLIVLVSGRQEFHKNIIHIPYKRKVPVIPDNTYSHVFVFYNGEEETLAILPTLIKKTNMFSGRILLLTPLGSFSEKLERRLSHHIYYSMPTVIFGEVFDSKLQFPNLVNFLIYQARNFKRLELPNEGIGKLYPVYLEDLVAVVIAIAFSHEERKGFHLAYPRIPFTELSVARVFQRINPDIKIDFSKKKVKIPSYYMPQEGAYVFSKYNLEGGLRRLLDPKVFAEGAHSKREIVIKAGKKEFNFKKLFLGIIAALVIPLLIILTTILSGTALLALSVKDATKGNFARAHFFSKRAESSFAFSKKLSESYFPANYVMPNIKDGIIRRSEAGEKASEAGKHLFMSAYSYQEIYQENSDSKRAGEKFVQSLSDTKNSLLLLDTMRATGALPESAQKALDKGDFMISLGASIIDTIPDILGFEKKKKYLLLFQNNMELRPGGGFIGSYGLISVENGKFGKVEIHDVYDADGKLTTHMEPPFALSRFGGATHWFLRDSNFAVEGSVTAAASTELLRRSTGEKVDGVVMLDTDFVKYLIEAIGPVDVADYKERVDSSNFYLLTQKHAEEGFFPGSTQKKDFLRSLLGSILNRLSESEAFPYMKIAGVVERSIKEKHLQFVPLDQKIQKIFAVNSLTGDILDEREEPENTFLDFLAIVDANIGANKGNYYLKRSVLQEASISQSGQLFGQTTITLENTSTKDSIFGGEYKTYLRLVLPRGSDIRSVLIDGRQVQIIDAVTSPSVYKASGFVPPEGLEIEKTEASGKDVFGFFTVVPVQSTKKISINYATPQAVSIEAPAVLYQMRLFKQPGTDADSYQLILDYPSNFIPVELSKGAYDLGGKVRYETKLTEDKDMQVKLTQK